MEPQEKEWLFVFFIHANLVDKPDANFNDQRKTLETKEQLETLINSLGQIPLSNQLQIILIENKVLDKNGITHFETHSLELVAPENDENINIFKEILPVETDESLFFNKKKFGEFLRTVFSRFTHFRFRKTALITWDHGSIFGIYKVDIQFTNILNLQNKRLYKKRVNGKSEIFDVLTNPAYKVYKKDSKETFPIFGANKALASSNVPLIVASRDIPGYIGPDFGILTNAELCEIIRTGFGRKIDVLIMYNCCMQNVYTQYDLKEAVKYLLAPQAAIGTPGYNFDELFIYLNNNNNATPEALILKLLNSVRTHKFYNDNSIKIESEWAIQAINLEDFDSFFESVVKLNEQILVFLKSNAIGQNFKFVLINHASSAYHYDKTSIASACLIDFNNFLTNLKNSGDLELIIIDLQLRRNFIQTIDEIIKFITNARLGKDFLGNNIYGVEGMTAEKDATGFSLFFPVNRFGSDDFRDLFISESSLTPSFLKATKWNEILNLCVEI